jgi:hypothetical protein
MLLARHLQKSDKTSIYKCIEIGKWHDTTPDRPLTAHLARHEHIRSENVLLRITLKSADGRLHLTLA